MCFCMWLKINYWGLGFLGAGGLSYSRARSGHTRSWQWGGQYSLIFSKRYWYLCLDNLGGEIMGGSWSALGLYLLSTIMFISRSGLLIVSLTTTEPGFELVKVRWCMLLIPLSAVCRNGALKTLPSCMWGLTSSHLGCPPTEHGLRQQTLQPLELYHRGNQPCCRRYSCLNSPKHQSGENFVWPTIKWCCCWDQLALSRRGTAWQNDSCFAPSSCRHEGQ